MNRRLFFVSISPIVALGATTLGAACSDESNAVPPPTTSPESGTTETSTPSDSSASDTSTADTAPTTLDVNVTFEARVGALPFACSTKYTNLGTTAAEVMPNDFRFYVHDVQLLKASDGTPVPLELTQDGKWQNQGVALLDFEDGSMGCATDGNPDTNKVVKGKVPAGAYKGLKITLGVPFTRNHQNQAVAPSPLNVGKMFWSWNSGYLFAKIESTPQSADPGTTYDPFLVHIGSTGCVGDAQEGGVTSCGKPNRLPMTFATFEAEKNKIVVDYAALVSTSDMLVNGGGPPGCMSFPGDPECPAVFTALGLDYTTGMPATAAGTAFKVE